MFSYMLNITLKNFPLIELKSSFRHKPPRQIESNACEKSMNAQKSFFLDSFAISFKEFRTKMCSVVPYPFLNPAWFSDNMAFSSKYSVNLLLSTPVNRLP